MAMSRIWAIAWRRACRSPRLPRVTSFSTTGRRSFAFGSVVMICSCLISAAAMLANMARRCSAVRFSLRWALPWRMSNSSDDEWQMASRKAPLAIPSVVILEALGEVVDVVGRPARDFHAEMEAHLRQHFLDLVERLAAEVRRAQHLGLGLLHQVADIDDVVVLETVGRTHAELELVHLLEEGRIEGQVGDGLRRLLLPRFLEVDEHVELVLQDA